MKIQSFRVDTEIRPILDLVPQEDGLQLAKNIFDYAAEKEVEPFRNPETARIFESIKYHIHSGVNADG